MKNENFVAGFGWMFNRLKLKGNEAWVFALIYGFSQDGKSLFSGSLSYIERTLNLSRNTVISILDKLEKKQLIIKHQKAENNMVFNDYSLGSAVSELGSAETDKKVVQKLTKGSAETAPHNIYNNIYNNISEYSKENFLTNWNELRINHLKTPSNLNKLYPDELEVLNENLKNFTKEDFQLALYGLFNQQAIPKEIMRFRPKHFLNNISQYLDAEKNKKYDLYV